MSARAARVLAEHISDTTAVLVTATFDNGRWHLQRRDGPTAATVRAAADHARSVRPHSGRGH